MPILPEDPKDRKYAILGIKIAGDFGATLAVPIVVFVVVAQWLAQKYGLGLWITILAFVLAASLSASIIVRKSKMYGKQYQDLDTDTKEN